MESTCPTEIDVENSQPDSPHKTITHETDPLEEVKRERRWFCCDCRGKMTLVEGKRCALDAWIQPLKPFLKW